jgi:hypothetical protein
VDLSAAVLEFDGVHHAVDEVDPAAVVSIDVLALAASGDAGWVEAVARIADDDQDPVLLVTRNRAVNLLAGITFTAVNDCVRKGLAQGEFDLEILTIAAGQLAGVLHQVVDNGRNIDGVGRKGHVHLGDQLIAVEFATDRNAHVTIKKASRQNREALDCNDCSRK